MITRGARGICEGDMPLPTLTTAVVYWDEADPTDRTLLLCPAPTLQRLHDHVRENFFLNPQEERARHRRGQKSAMAKRGWRILVTDAGGTRLSAATYHQARRDGEMLRVHVLRASGAAEAPALDGDAQEQQRADDRGAEHVLHDNAAAHDDE